MASARSRHLRVIDGGRAVVPSSSHASTVPTQATQIRNVPGVPSYVSTMIGGGRAYGPLDDESHRRDPRRHPVPPLWDAAISEWVGFMRSAGAAHTSVRTRREYLETLARRIGVASPWDVTSRDLITLLGRMRWSPNTRYYRRAAYNLFYEWAIDMGLTDHNPVEKVPTPRLLPPKPRPAPIDVYQRSYERASGVVRIILRLAFEIGMRRGEIAVIHRNDILAMPHGPTILVHGKGGKTRLLPLPHDLADELTRICTANTGYLLPGQVDGHMSPRRVGEIASAALEGDWTLHTLRHACGTGLLAGGVNLRVIQEILGHSSVATTQIYTGVDDYQLRAAIERRASQPTYLRAS